MTTGTDPIDEGTIGPAAESRPHTSVALATGSVAIGRETITVRKYTQTHLFDRLAHAGQISDRQYKVAEQAMRRFAAAGIEANVTGTYAPRGWTHGADLSQADDHPEPLQEWRALLADMPAGEAEALERACLGQHPGMRLAALQGALDRLGEVWGVRDE